MNRFLRIATATTVALSLTAVGCEPASSDATPTSTDQGDASATPQPDAAASPDSVATPDDGPVAGGQCHGAEPMPATGLTLEGNDFYADFQDTFHFDEASCEQVKLLADAHVESVVAVPLEAGQTLGMCQRGEVLTVNYIVTDCGSGQDIACAASSSDSTPCMTYTATQAETVFAVVEAYFDSSEARDYRIELGLDPTCGDGIREAGEECDDGNTVGGDGCDSCAIEYGFVCHYRDGGSDCYAEGCGDGILVEAGVGNEECDDNNLVDGDGCNASCDVEDGYNCGAYPGEAACWPTPSHTVNVGTPVDATWPGILLTRFHDGTVTFTEDVLFSGSVTGTYREDGAPAEMNFQLVPEAGGTILITTDDGTWSDVAVAAGTYRFSVRPWGGTVDGYSYHFEVAR